ncbi:hypothetical protein UFOVP712_9 [uncultured Caudovirales phage]|uniref:Uncharacterized protein n=1 Tax=uncultured Caudovirales phage TaxID=2100421 RepID=A0A6J5NNE7_9CAUD|nr:hypothetical protein UFOVP712_9 [uncultured Caudovirales phage]
MDGIKNNMTLFPYAGQVEYREGNLKFVLTFFDRENTTEMTLDIGLDDNLIEMIEGLLKKMDEV